MSTDASAPTGPHQQPTAAGVSWRAVAVPTEHGGWSLTAEPVVLGLLVAFSWPGFALGLAAMIAFVARTPLKVVLVDRWRQRWLDRTRLAARIAAVELAVAAALTVYAVLEGASGFWVPLAVAAPLVALELWYDMRSRSRRLVPELAGSIGIGSIAAAIALADAAPTRVAWGLWLVMAARSLSAIPYVRTQIRRRKAKPGALWSSDLAQLGAVIAAWLGWSFDLVPLAATVAISVLAALNVLAVRLPTRSAVTVGIQQTIVGIIVIATTAVAIHLA